MDAHDKGRELFFLAQEARKHGRHAEAERHLREALLHAPGRESIRTNLCGALIDQGKHAEALPLCAALVQDFPASAVGWHRLSLCQFATSRYADALDSVERSIALAPENADTQEHRVAVLLQRKELEAALEACRSAVGAFPQTASLRTALGVVHGTRRELHEARECHEAALRLDLGDADKRWNLALSQLMLGEFAEGWDNFEARWTAGEEVRVESLYAGSTPRWDGSAALQGQRILVWAEQGLGDTIQFCRYVPLLVQAGAQVSLQVPGALLSLMQHNLPGVTVFGRGQALPPHDFNLPLLSLPRFVGDAAKPPLPLRLSAPAFHRGFWPGKFGERRAPRVGLMWEGNLGNQRGLHRSLRLAELADVLSLPLEFHCVSNTVSSEDAMWLRANAPSVRSHTPYIKDFSDTTALIEQLDLLISIDTSVAHLAGSLDVPAWILLARAADWRWGPDTERTPWYPQSRLFRQQATGDWQAPVQALRAALVEHFGLDD